MSNLVTDEQHAALRAFLSGDFDEHQRLVEQFDAGGESLGFAAMRASAFTVAVRRRFGKGYTPADIIRYVADVRESVDQGDGDIDPYAAERLIIVSMQGGTVEGVDEETRAAAQTVLLADLVIDEQLDDEALEAFLDEARGYANEFLAR